MELEEERRPSSDARCLAAKDSFLGGRVEDHSLSFKQFSQHCGLDPADQPLSRQARQGRLLLLASLSWLTQPVANAQVRTPLLPDEGSCSAHSPRAAEQRIDAHREGDAEWQ